MQRYAGDKIVGLSTDVKPTTILDGATFYELDTKNLYILSESVWTPVTASSGGSSVWSTTGHDIYYATGKVTVGADIRTSLFNIVSASYATDFMSVYYDDGVGGIETRLFYISGSKQVGINTDTMNYTFDVSGSIHSTLLLSTGLTDKIKIKENDISLDIPTGVLISIDSGSTNKNISIIGSEDFAEGIVGAYTMNDGTGNWEPVWYYNNLSNPVELHIGNNLIVTGSITELSSKKLKKNIHPLKNSLENIIQLQGVKYDRIDTNEKNQIGLIAEDVEKIYPELVTKDKNGNIMGIQYNRVVPILIEAIKKLNQEIEILKENK